MLTPFPGHVVVDGPLVSTHLQLGSLNLTEEYLAQLQSSCNNTDTALRAALDNITDRLARLVARLPPLPSPTQLPSSPA